MPADVDIPLVDHRRLAWRTEDDSLLGQGSFGIVYRGTFDSSPVAIKVVKPARNPQTNADNYNEAETAAIRQHHREVHRLAAVRNPYIIQYLGVFRDRQSRDLYIVTEFLEGGSLHDSLCKMRARNAVLDDRSFLQIASQMAYGLNHVHSESYTHGDMKPQNILLSESISIEEDGDESFSASFAPSARVKIADFGLSKRLEGAIPVAFRDSVLGTTEFGAGPCGTYLYMAPEAYMGVSEMTDADAKSADIYAYGLILYELLSGLQSWSVEQVRNPMRLQFLVQSGKRPSWGDRRNIINSNYKRLVERCWSDRAGNRSTAAEIVNELRDLQRLYALRIPSGRESVSAHHGVSRNSARTAKRPSRDTEVEVSSNSRSSSPGALEVRAAEQDVDKFSTQHSLAILGNVSEQHHTASGDDDDATIVPVESMRTLKQSQEVEVLDHIANAGGGLSREEATSSVSSPGSADISDVGCQEGTGKTLDWERGTDDNESLKDNVGQKGIQGCTNLGVSEIDESVVGGVQVMRVQSVPFQLPEVEPLQVPQDGEKRATMGTGSIAGNIALPSSEKRRTGAELLESFVIAGAGLREDESNVEMRRDVHENPENDSMYRQNESMGTDKNKRSNVLATNVHQLETNGTDPEPSAETLAQERDAYQYPVVNAEASFFVRDIAEDATPSQLLAREDPLRQRTNTSGIGQCSPLEYGSHRGFPISHGAVLSTPSKWTLQSQGLSAPNISHLRKTDALTPSPVIPGQKSCSDTTLCGASGSRPHNEKVRTSLSKYRPLGTMTGHGATAPPLSETAYSAAMGSTWNPMLQGSRKSRIVPWPLPGLDNCPAGTQQVSTSVPSNTFLRGSHVDISEVLRILQAPEASLQLRSLWNRGCTRSVAAGLAQSRSLNGNEKLQLACDFLAQSSQCASSTRDPMMVKDLYAAIGNSTRNESVEVRHENVLIALRLAVSTLTAYGPSFVQNESHTMEVYTSCNFALGNLLKANNVIPEPQLRADLATWILYIMRCNIPDDGISRGPHVDMLSYATTSAARNFMWMNEDNVMAFDGGKSPIEGQLISRLVLWMKYFIWTNSLPLLEVGLSALATAINFRQQREDFVAMHGIALVIDVLERHLNSAKITKLGFSMVTMLMSLSVQSHDLADKVEQWCMADKGCFRILVLLNRMQQSLRRDKESVETLKKGCVTLLSCARFSNRLRAMLVEEGAVGIVASMMRWLSMVNELVVKNQEEEGMVSATLKLGVTLCELVQQLSREPEARSDFRNETSADLEKMLPQGGGNRVFTDSLLATLQILSSEEGACEA